MLVAIETQAAANSFGRRTETATEGPFELPLSEPRSMLVRSDQSRCNGGDELSELHMIMMRGFEHKLTPDKRECGKCGVCGGAIDVMQRVGRGA
jgi:hypothetical protein